MICITGNKVVTLPKEEIRISPNLLEGRVGQSGQVQAKLAKPDSVVMAGVPYEMHEKFVFSATDSRVITIDQEGRYTFVGPGEAHICSALRNTWLPVALGNIQVVDPIGEYKFAKFGSLKPTCTQKIRVLP